MAYTETQNNIPALHRKEWQTMTPAPSNTAAGSFVAFDPSSKSNYALYMVSATVHYLYHHDEDDWIPITSGAFGGAFGAGACGCYHPWTPAYTANGGSTTTIQVSAATHNIIGIVIGSTIEMLSGTAANIGLRRTVTTINANNGAGNIILTLDSALASSVANSDTFKSSAGSFFVLTPGTLATTCFRRYDLGTMTWNAGQSVTGLPATWGTDGKLTTPAAFGVVYDTGTATGSTGTSLVDSGAGWGSDQFINFQVRISSGTGMGQVRTITDNDATSLTVAAWSVNPSTDSVYVVEGNEDNLYLLGNNNVAMYKYSISGNSWSTIAPTSARAAAPGIGMSADFLNVSGDAGWADVSTLRDGRYLYSVRGAAGAVIDRFDISGGTAGAGAWQQVVYHNTSVTFTTGSSSFSDGRHIYIAKEGSTTVPQRFYKFSCRGNYLEPFATDWYLGGAGNLGNKIWVKHLSSTGAIRWLYVLQAASANLRRIMII